MWWIPELLLEESRTASPQAIFAPKSMAISSNSFGHQDPAVEEMAPSEDATGWQGPE